MQNANEDNNLATILQMISSLKHQELLALNDAIIHLLKSLQAQHAAEQSANFNIGDIVVFTDDNQKQIHGMISRKNPKTIQVVTTDSYSVNVPPRYLTHSPNAAEIKLKFQQKLDLITKAAAKDFAKLLATHPIKPNKK